MSLRDEILALGIPLTDHGAISSALSEGRTKLVPTEIGNGMILQTIGLASGNALLDYLNNTAGFRHVKPLLEQGRLDVSSALVRAMLDQFAAGGLITQAEADALKALAVHSDPVTPLQVARILEGAE